MNLNVGKELAALRRMTVGELRARYAEAFGKTTNARHKDWLVKWIIWLPPRRIIRHRFSRPPYDNPSNSFTSRLNRARAVSRGRMDEKHEIRSTKYETGETGLPLAEQRATLRRR